jgi:tetratricopeptide (TPR) repeat protein
MGKPTEALYIYQEALKFEPDNPDLHYNLGVVLIELGQPVQALVMFNNALKVDPDHVQSLMNSAILMQESGKPASRPEAYQRLYRVMESQPDNDRIYFNLGMLAMDESHTTKAETWFSKAIQLRPDFRSALFNLALLLNEQKRPLEALPHLDSLLKHFPEHIKGLILLGDIYTNHVKDLDKAEKAYKRILEIDPTHVQGHHNLCVVMVEKKDLEAAHQCLLQVHKMAPSESYIKRHLQIVEQRLSSSNGEP